MKLVVGLGNPGNQYEETRHNIGWMVLDRLADRHGRSGRGRQRDASSTIELRTKGLELILAKPQTYMNDSGVAVRKLLARDRVPLGEMLVIADDFALPFGKLRFRESGSHGGHNGLRSIIDELGTEKYARLRVGIGEPGRGAVDHVLSKFAADERTRLPILLDAAADAVEAWAREGTSKAANRFNSFELQAPAAPGEGDPAAPDPARSAGRPTSPGCAGRRRAGAGSWAATAAEWRRERRARRGRGRAEPALSDRYRGRTTRQRNVADRVAREWAERRAAAEASEQRVDLDRASAEAEVELLDPAARPDAAPPARPRGRGGRRAAPAPARGRAIAARPGVVAGAGSRTSRRCRGCSTRRAPSRPSASGSARSRRRRCTAGTSA